MPRRNPTTRDQRRMIELEICDACKVPHMVCNRDCMAARVIRGVLFNAKYKDGKLEI